MRVLPHSRSFDDPAQMEEERRLCYVGMTRSETRLYLVNAIHRRLFGGMNANPPSRYLRDIPPHLMESTDPIEGMEKPLVTSTGLLVLKVGDRIRHDNFGEGIVVNCSRNRDDHEVVVDFENIGVKRLLLSLAPLEKIDDPGFSYE